MDTSLIIPIFLAGLLTFLAPCTLPLIPGFLTSISGVSLSKTKLDKNLKKKIFINGLFYVIGFSIVFIILGSLIGVLGTTLNPYREVMTKVAGIFVILFGVFLLGVIKIPSLYKEKRTQLNIFKPGTKLNSAALGSSFALGWTPCVGPILASVLLLAASTTTIIQASFLLTIFSLGLAVPFLIIAATISRSTFIIQKIAKYTGVISKLGGIFLIALGLLLFTNNLDVFVEYGFRLLQFLNYDAIMNYL